jgi:cyclic pyranopterin phosphate synthase
MDERMRFLPRAQLLTLEELALVGQAFVELGVTKIRLTGGEPLVRKNILQLVQTLGNLASLKELALTTNGSQLPKMAPSLQAAGIKRINISLDSLKPERFQKLSRVGKLATVLSGIAAAIQAGFQRIKINAVILKNRNHDEVIDLTQFAIQHGIDISFIEAMPMGIIGDHNRAEAFYSNEQIRQDLQSTFTLIPTTETTGGPAKYYQIINTSTRIGFISPHTHNFCNTCNRVRITTEGRLLLCLGQEHSVDLRRIIRAHPSEIEPLKRAIVKAIDLKPKGHDFNLDSSTQILRHMNVTGG